jgi:NAD(P)-dependent dehydrogenase (short-subunit alcohol dehydrogenase family)
MPHGFGHLTKENAMTDLTNKTALVTGASRGMGRAAALALAAAGARVIVHYGRGADEAQSVVAQIRADGGRADAVAADLAAPDGAHVLAAQVRSLVSNFLIECLILLTDCGARASARSRTDPRLTGVTWSHRIPCTVAAKQQSSAALTCSFSR